MPPTAAAPLVLALLAPPTALQNGLNRLQLDNGGDVVAWLNDPYVGGDPAGGDYTGDFFWKVFPAESFVTPSGELGLTGIEYWVFDQDWDLDDATLWAYTLTAGVDSADLAGGGSGMSPGSVEPDFDDPLGVFVPEVPEAGLGNPEGTGGCPAPGEIAGWLVTETWEEPGTGEPLPLVTLVADGSRDAVYSGFFPAGQSATFGGVHCGGGGNATFQYFTSADTPDAPEGGENLPDSLGTGYNAYGGRHFGDPTGAGFHVYVPHPFDRTASLGLFFADPTLHLRVDAGIDDHGPELGLATLEVPLGLDGAGLPAGTSSRLGWRLYSSTATPGEHFGVAFASVGALLPAPGVPVLGGHLLLSPDDPLFLPALFAWGVVEFETLSTGETAATSGLVPIDPVPSLVNTAIHFQGFELDLDPLGWRPTPATRAVFRPNEF